MSRYNLAQNPSFISNASYWAATSGASIAWTNEDGFFGNTCAKVTRASTANSGIQSSTVLASVTPGTYYAVSAHVKLPVGTQETEFRLSWEWYDDTVGTTKVGDLEYGYDPELILDTDGWVKLVSIAVAPVGAYGMKLFITQPNEGTAGDIFYVDAIIIEKSDSSDSDPFGEYFINLDQAAENTLVNRSLTEVPIPHITGMQLNADIILNGLVLNTVDEDGVIWVCTGINGWWGQADVEIQDLPRGLGDGSYDVNGRYAARQIEVTGVFLTPDSSYITKARNKLIQATDLVRKKGLLLTHEEYAKAAYVRLSGKPTITTVNARGRTEFSIGLRAVDPIKYHWNPADPEGYSRTILAATGTLPVTTTVTNLGNTNVPVQLTMSGILTAGATVANETTGTVLTLGKTLSGPEYVFGEVLSSSTEWDEARGVDVNTAVITTVYAIAAGDTFIIPEATGPVVDTDAHLILSATVVSQGQVEILWEVPNTEGAHLETAGTYTGDIALNPPETLTIDTGLRNVLLNSNVYGDRSYLDTFIDWLVLEPGENIITVTGAGVSDNGDVQLDFRSGWIG